MTQPGTSHVDGDVGRRHLVIGASGFIGRWVARELLDRGDTVHAQARTSSRLPPDVAKRVSGIVLTELDHGKAAERLLGEVEPDVVFDLSGYGVAKSERDESQYERINAHFPLELAEAISRQGRSTVLVHVGSVLEVGPDAESLDETVQCRPSTTYGRSKLQATRGLDAIRDRGVACLTARAFTFFGIGERPGRLVPTLLAAAGREGRIPLSEGFQRRDWTYVEDLAKGLVGLAGCDPDAIRDRRPPFDAPCVNIASGELHTVREFVEIFAARFGIDPARLGFGDIPSLPEETPHPPPPVGRLVAALGWRPPASPADGIQRLFSRWSESEAS